MTYAIPLGHGREPGPCMCGATDCKSCGPAQGHRLDDGDDFDLDAEVEILTDEGAEFDPYNARNLAEAIGEMTDGHFAMLGERLRKGQEHEAFVILKHCADYYWREQARQHARKMAGFED